VFDPEDLIKVVVALLDKISNSLLPTQSHYWSVAPTWHWRIL